LRVNTADMAAISPVRSSSASNTSILNKNSRASSMLSRRRPHESIVGRISSSHQVLSRCSPRMTGRRRRSAATNGGCLSALLATWQL
jgi:hypothetical protein